MALISREEYEATWRRKNLCSTIFEWVIVGSLIACIPFGLVMALWTNNGDWLWFCAVLIIFLS